MFEIELMRCIEPSSALYSQVSGPLAGLKEKPTKKLDFGKKSGKSERCHCFKI